MRLWRIADCARYLHLCFRRVASSQLGGVLLLGVSVCLVLRLAFERVSHTLLGVSGWACAAQTAVPCAPPPQAQPNGYSPSRDVTGRGAGARESCQDNSATHDSCVGSLCSRQWGVHRELS